MIATCGAKTKSGAPCKAYPLKYGSMSNGRCRRHGANHAFRATHGATTRKACRERKRERDLLRNLRMMEIEDE